MGREPGATRFALAPDGYFIVGPSGLIGRGRFDREMCCSFNVRRRGQASAQRKPVRLGNAPLSWGPQARASLGSAEAGSTGNASLF